MEKEFLGGYSKGWWDSAKKNRALVRKYNTIDPQKLWEKYLLLKELLAQADEQTLIEPPFYCDNGWNIRVGKNFYANYNLVILDTDKVTFGDRVVIGPNVTFCAASHPLHPESRFHDGHFPVLTAPITVGDDVWIGANVTVLMGVTIGSGSVIGAGSVVTRDIPGGVIAAGSPCRVLREITEKDRHIWEDGHREPSAAADAGTEA